MNSRQQFEEIYIKYSDKIYRYVYLSINDPYLAEDIVSEVFLRVWRKWSKIKLNFIQALLYKIAKNIIVDLYRKQKNRRQISLEETMERGIEPFYDQKLIENLHKDDNIQKLNQQIKLLPQNLKEVLILRFINEMSAREVGVALDMTEVNVRVLQYRAIKKLKEVIKNE